MMIRRFDSLGKVAYQMGDLEVMKEGDIGIELLFIPIFENVGKIRARVSGIEKPKDARISTWAIVGIILGGACGICIIAAGIRVIYQYYKAKVQRINHRKVHSEVQDIQRNIQNQSHNIEDQSVSFEQVACYNNYLIYKEGQNPSKPDKPTKKPAFQSSHMDYDQMHTGNIISLSTFKPSRSPTEDLQMLSQIGLIRLD
ncbi:unnamed protein product [Moneuplotes crassus]|uniref:Uncharacterized protein n=1 Tax=Euplotes crassus TaxID=5936 RepID=A0AAD1UH12_EUPCR|nr:unnamed protein product [Moneuplotes crassus]